eukprot:Hpha_TRINITY_DN7721_c0_g1::TRINITY_DN7721_c0_g1_i2::g.85353::m.85353
MGDENALLSIKFTTGPYKEMKMGQKMREVTPQGREEQAQRSTTMWKRLNPGEIRESPVYKGILGTGYCDEPKGTTNKELLTENAAEFKVQNTHKDNFRVRDKHTEYVEHLVRDQALARKHGGK